MAVIETTTFRLADGIDDAAFLAADERVRTGFLYRQPGLMRATTAHGDGGDWIVVVLWQSAADADAAAAAAESDPASAGLTALVDGTTLQRNRYTTFD
jgi:hypothetical protein